MSEIIYCYNLTNYDLHNNRISEGYIIGIIIIILIISIIEIIKTLK
jgi:hypothetical protein